MSAYIETHTPMIEKGLLIEALCKAGFQRQQIEVHENAQNLVGYEGYGRKQSAKIIIRRQYVGRASNDIGFKMTPTGYKVIISAYDQGKYGRNWQNQLFGHYETLLRQREEAEERRRKEAELEAKRLAEEEARRKAEEARKKLIQTQKQMILQRAKKMNYMAKERQVGGEIQLMLVRRHY